MARTAYWQELHHDYSYDVLDFVVARAECDYVSAAMLRETVRVEVWLSKVGTTSFVLAYRKKSGPGRQPLDPRSLLEAIIEAVESAGSGDPRVDEGRGELEADRSREDPDGNPIELFEPAR